MKNVLSLFFPKQIDNKFRGYKIALYVFYVLTAVTLWRSQHHLFAADGGAQSIATIPLDKLSEMGATAVIGVFGLWGLSQLIIAFIYLIASLRYKSMIPMLYVLMLIEYLFRAFYFPTSKPIPTAGTAPGALINLPFIILTITMIVLIILSSKKKEYKIEDVK
jgi:hypothetical protein